MISLIFGTIAVSFGLHLQEKDGFVTHMMNQWYTSASSQKEIHLKNIRRTTVVWLLLNPNGGNNIVFDMTTNAIEPRSMMWNLWHGCHKLSAGCNHCYVYRGDAKHDIDSSIVVKTKNFDLPVRKKRNGEYKMPSGTLVYTCFTSDFFVEDADPWRTEAWQIMRLRSDLNFLIITKRVDRLQETLPSDWGNGYDNVTICCTIENQNRTDYRLPIYKTLPIKHKVLICEPLLERIDLRHYDIGSWIEQVVVGGESGYEARPCHFDWVMEIHDLCVENNVSFWFKQTGAKFVKDGKLYPIKRQFQHSQARKAGLNFK